MFRFTLPCLFLPVLSLACAAHSEGEPTESHRQGLDVSEGIFESVVHDDIDGSVHHFDQLRRPGEPVLQLRFEAGLAPPEAGPQGSALRVYGQALGDHFLVSDFESLDGDAPGASEKLGATRQPLGMMDRTAGVILINFTGTPSPYDPGAMKEAVYGSGHSANTFYLEGSFGTSKLIGITDPTGDIWGPVDVPYADCDAAGGYETAAEAARSAAQGLGAPISEYQHIVTYFPPVDSGCPGGGIAGGRFANIFGIGINSAWDYVAHEVGHTFGLGHASSYTDCTSLSGNTVTISCGLGGSNHDEYGDQTDVMGGRNFLFSSYHLERLNWLPQNNILVLEQSARVLISPLPVAVNGIQSLRVPRTGGSGDSEFFHFEYRQRLGEFDSNIEIALTEGVLVRTTPDGGSRGNPHILDMTPGSSGQDMRDAALGLGMTFQDGSMSATVAELTPDYAVLDVTIDGVAPDPNDPRGAGGAATGVGGATTGMGGGSGAGGAGGSAGASGGSSGMAGATGIGGAGDITTGAGGTTPGMGGASTGVGGTAGAGVAGAGVAGTGVPPASSTVGDDSGCACRLVPSQRKSNLQWLAPLAMLGVLTRRRRRA